MKIKGHKRLKRRREVVEIGVDEDGEKVRLVLLETPIGLLDRLNDELPMPEVPENGALLRDKFGSIQKDDAGQAMRAANPKDPAYLKAKGERYELFLQALAIEMLAPGQVEWRAKRKDFELGADYYKALIKEAGEQDDEECGGMGQEALDALVKATLRLRGVDDKTIEEAGKELGGERNGHPTEPSSTGASESNLTLASIPTS